MVRHWTKEEDKIIKDKYSEMGLKIKELLPQRTTGAIKNRAVKLGVRAKEPDWNNVEDIFILNNYGSLTIEEMSEALHRSESAIRHRMYKIGACKRIKRWTADEINILKENRDKSRKEIQKMMPYRTISAIQTMLNIIDK